MQFDKTANKAKNIFISAAVFKYPTLKYKELKELDVVSISADDSLLFMWTTAPHMQTAIALGNDWGFDYKTVAFVWDKQMHNPGHYTISQTEFCLVFKKGRIPTPRGARNIKQLISVPRGKHSEKPEIAIEGITKMFPEQKKIELFARKNYMGWDNWGLEIPKSKIEINSQYMLSKNNELQLTLLL